MYVYIYNIYIYIYIYIFKLDYPKKLEATFSLIQKQINMMSDLKKMQRACLKVLLKLLVIYFLPHQLLLSVFKEKTESCILVVIFLWNVLDPFNPMFHL